MLSIVSTLICCVRSAPPSGLNVWMLRSHTQVICGGHSTSYLIVAGHHLPLTSRSSISYHLLLTQTYLPSRRLPRLCAFTSFYKITHADVVTAVKNLPNKQCTSDPLPTWLLKQSVQFLAAFLSLLFHCTLEHGIIPSRFKNAYVIPILMNADLDPADVKSYRPIYNLVSTQLLQYL